MMDFPLVCVVDANILIDLHTGGLLEEIFRLPFRLVSPDLVIDELHEPNGWTLVEHGLESHEFSGAQMQQLGSLVARYRKPSTNDLSTLVLARALKGTLLTGEKHLRDAAMQEGVLVHGTLWVLDEMIRLELISPSQAAQALEQMLAQGRRLPQIECRRRLKQWSEMS